MKTAFGILCIGLIAFVVKASEVDSTQMKNPLLRNLDASDEQKPDAEPSCPFIADEYDVRVDTGSSIIDIRFKPSDLGIESGYYCSLSTELYGKALKYNFENCSCGYFMTCDTNWETVQLNVLGIAKDVQVGQCQPNILAMMLSTLLLLCCCCGSFRVLRMCCRKRRYVVVEEVLEERLIPSENMRAQTVRTVVVEPK